MTTFASSARTPAAPLVGREREQSVLRERFVGACAGHGGLVLIGGEAGIGKSALAEALCHEATKASALVLVGRCYDLTETPPYGPWADCFGRYQPTDTMPPRPAAFSLRGGVGEVASQSALFQDVQDFLSALAASQPVVLFLDDLHWADLASLDLLRFLARSLTTLRVLLVATYRSDELNRRHPLYALLPMLVRETSAMRADLRPLRSGDIAALVQARYRLPDADAVELGAYLNDRSEGNPFFLGELLRTLEEEEVLQPAESGWSLGALAGVQVPSLLRQVIDGRVARLGEDAQVLLAVAAIIGQDVPFAVWASVSEGDEAMLLDLVEQATAAHLVDAPPDGTGFRFAHALIREALYEGILPLRRRVLHRHVGEALIALSPPDPDAVAFHFQRASDPRARAWLVRAGERAEEAYALMTASARYEAALALLPDDRTAERGWLLYRVSRVRFLSRTDYLDEVLRCADASGDRALAAVALYQRGYVRCHNGDERAGVAELVAGADAIMALTPEERSQLEALPGQSAAERAAPHGTAIIWAANTGRYAQALALGARWIQPERSTPAALANGWAGLCYTFAALGRPADAGAAFEKARAGYTDVGHYIQLSSLTGLALGWIVLPYQADRPDERRRVVEALVTALVPFVEARWDDPMLARIGAIAAGAEVTHRLPRQAAQRLHAALCRERGMVTEAWAQVHALLPNGPASDAEEAYLSAATFEVQRVAALLALDAGELATAKAWLEAHRRWQVWSGAVVGQSEAAALWAQYHRQAGDADEARAHAERALAHATSPRQPLALLAAHRLLGELATEAGQYDDAIRRLDESRTLADACAAPYERALTLLSLAEMRAATGDDAAAVVALDEARAICTPLGAKPALARADALAARLSRESAHASKEPGGLSAREVEVLRLVAQGMTDTQVAARLYLSPRTVGQHLRNIYNKLGVSTRNAAARFAIEHHLT
jgi:DNA-binding CsgD family transcriptional regulator